ncbi:MAG: invasion associated locus B family protein [Rhizobiaceae bacterium]|nr:invasion associated locus B family protein [Rhizobiaceae bacterium]
MARLRVDRNLGKSWGIGVIAAIILTTIIPLAVLHTHQKLIAAGVQPAELAASGAQSAAAGKQPWTKFCVDGQPVCAVEQTIYVADAQGNSAAVMRISIGPGSDNPRLHLMVYLPSNIRKDQGVGFQIDNGVQSRLTVNDCKPEACTVSLIVSAGGRAALETGNVIHMSFTDVGNQLVTLPIDLTGLSAALKRLGV